MSGPTLQEKIQNMLDEIPDSTGTHREHSLSKTSARWLANMALLVSEHHTCNHKFTPELVEDIKDVVKERRRIKVFIGAMVTAILIYIGQKFIDMCDPGFWKHLFGK